MSFQLVNLSGYDSASLRRFLRRGFQAEGLRRHVTVKVVSAPSRTKGCAVVGGRRIVFALAPPGRLSMRRFALVLRHEVRHILGRDHHQMSEPVRYSTGAMPAWARGLRLRYRGRAPAQRRAWRRQGLTGF